MTQFAGLGFTTVTVQAALGLGPGLHFAESLFDAPVPPDLDEDEAYYYRMELEDQAFPIEDKAMQAWKRNLDLAAKLGIRNNWVQASRDRLIKLFPDLARHFVHTAIENSGRDNTTAVVIEVSEGRTTDAG